MARVNYFDLWSPDCIKTFTDHCHTEHSLIMFFKEGKTFPIYTTRVYVRLMNIFFKNIYILKKLENCDPRWLSVHFASFNFAPKSLSFELLCCLSQQITTQTSGWYRLKSHRKGCFHVLSNSQYSEE